MLPKINQSFAYKILKEGLLDAHNIDVNDPDLFSVLDAASNGNHQALHYLQNSTEVQDLLHVLQNINDTYTSEHFDVICSYLSNHPGHCDGLYFAYNDFYEETIADMIYYLQYGMLQFQSIDDLCYLIHCIGERKKQLVTLDFPPDHTILTFVVRVSFDPKDGCLVHEILMGRTPDSVSENALDDEEDDDDMYVEESLDIVDHLDNFISVWSKRTYDKQTNLLILKSLSYGDTLFQMFDLQESIVRQ